MKYDKDCDSVLNPVVDMTLLTQKPDRPQVANERIMPHLRPAEEVPPQTDLVIVGAGLAGITLAARAWHLGFSGDRIAILDPNPTFAHQFDSRTSAIKQKLMRSPYMHHVAPAQDFSLADYARLRSHLLTEAEKRQLQLARMGERALPPLDLFMGHTAHVVRTHRLPQRAFRFRVERIEREEDRWLLQDAMGRTVRARYVILAMGMQMNELQEMPSDGIHVWNALHDSVDDYLAGCGRTVCVVGSGNTAAHVILEAVRRGKRAHWIMRGPFPLLNDDTLELIEHPNLFVASAHSALSLGPAAKNIDGARIAMERIFGAIHERETGIQEIPLLKRLRLARWSRLTSVAVPDVDTEVKR